MNFEKRCDGKKALDFFHDKHLDPSTRSLFGTPNYFCLSLQEVTESQIDLNSAYMLFYQRAGLSVDKYLPSVEGKVPYPKEMDEESEAEYKKQCVMM